MTHLDKLETDQELRLGAMEVTKIIKRHGHFPDIPPTYSVKEIPMDVVIKGQFKDTILFDPEDQEMSLFREYRFSEEIEGKNYFIVHRHFGEDFWRLFIEITPVISVLLCFLFLVMMVYNRYMSENLWKDFKINLNTLKKYSLNKQEKLELVPTQIDEFDDLNKVLMKMSDRLGKDYESSKEFSANAAHELQTPLAIIRNKCEDLFSKDELSEDTVQTIREIYLSSNRLSGMTKALLLLAKIDHGQFNEDEKIFLSEIINEKIAFYEDIIEDKFLRIKVKFESEVPILMDKRLATLWIENIIINSIKHSKPNKEINIEMKNNGLSISNYGEEAIKEPEQIFNRFYTETNESDSTGIGLSIVKKIADYYEMQITYDFNELNHTFSFHFQSC
jgi:signal transduction histidine kinase